MKATALAAARETGIYWLGAVPHSWEVKRNGAIFEERDERGRDDLPIMSVSLVSGVEVRDFSSDYIQPVMGDLRQYKIAVKGDIVFNKMRMWQGAVGTSPVTGLVSPDYTVLKPRAGVDARFFNYVYRTPGYNCEVGRYSHGIALDRNRIYWDEFKAIPTPVPPPREQTRIADLLDRKTAAVDALIERKGRLVALLQEKRQALVTQAVTKGLDPSVPMKDSGVELLGEVPAHWQVRKLKHVATVHAGIAKGRDLGQATSTVSLPYLRVANVQDGFLKLDDVAEIEVLRSEVERFSLRAGDVLMNEGGDNDKLGRGAVWEGQINPCLHQNHVFAVRPHRTESPHWIALVTESYPLRCYFQTRAKQTTNLASISSTNLKEAPVPLPPSREQQKIIATVRTRLAQVNSLEQTTRRSLSLLREYRQALITAAVTGKLDLSKEAC